MDKIYRSQAQSAVAGTITFSDFIEPLGPTGRPNVIQRLVIKCAGQVDVATAAWEGEDVPKIAALVQVSDLAGTIRSLTGQELRIWSLCTGLGSGYHEQADVAVGSNATFEMIVEVPLEHRPAYEPTDFGLLAAAFASAKITVAAAADVSTAAAVTYDSLSWTVEAECREVDGIHVGARDVITSEAMSAQTAHTFALRGVYLGEMFAYVSGDAGGASMANWTDHRLVGVYDEPMEDADQIARFRREYGLGDVGTTPGGEVVLNPITASRAVAVHLPRFGHKLRDLPFLSKGLKLNVTTGVANSVVIHRTIEPRSESLGAKIGRRFGVSPASFRIHTKRGSRRNPSAWKGDAAYMPVRAPFKAN